MGDIFASLVRKSNRPTKLPTDSVSYSVIGLCKFSVNTSDGIGYAVVNFTEELLDNAIPNGAEFYFKANAENSSTVKPNLFFNRDILVSLKKKLIAHMMLQ